MKTMLPDADLTGFGWIGLVVVAASIALMRFAPPGVGIAITVLSVWLWRGWRERRSDQSAAKAWLFDHTVAVAGCWAIAWTLVLAMPVLLALVIAFSAMFARMAWRQRSAARLAG
jgi:hypothetical protein